MEISISAVVRRVSNTALKDTEGGGRGWVEAGSGGRARRTKETNLDEMTRFGRSQIEGGRGGRPGGEASLHLSSRFDLVLYLLLGSSRCINRQEEHTARVK